MGEPGLGPIEENPIDTDSFTAAMQSPKGEVYKVLASGKDSSTFNQNSLKSSTEPHTGTAESVRDISPLLGSAELSAAEIQEIQKIPETVRRTVLTISGRKTELTAFGSAKIENLSIGNPGSEGGVIFYRDLNGNEYTLKFFNAISDRQRREVINHLESFDKMTDEKRGTAELSIDTEDLWRLTRGFPMVRWLGRLDETYFLPVLNQGMISSTGIEPTDETEPFRAALRGEQRYRVPYVLMPYLKLAKSCKVSAHEYRELENLDLLIDYDLGQNQAVLAPAFRGKTIRQINQIARNQFLDIKRAIEETQGIILRDVEPAVDLATGDMKILDTGISLPIESPTSELVDYLQELYGLTDAQKQALVARHNGNTTLNIYRQKN